MTNDSKKVLFIDRDGTILVEPMPSEQVDSFDKMDFVEGAISALKSIAGLDYELVLASNQDGLGTPGFPYEDYIGPHSLMQRVLASEGVRFADELIDPTMPEEKAPTRKPGIGMFTKYLGGEYDLTDSYVIGDRPTDVQLAKNLGCKSILLDMEGTAADSGATFVARSWAEIAEYLRRGSRVVTIERNTRETKISVTVDLDGRIGSSVSSGLKFFDHMLEQIVHHGGVSLQLSAVGDLEVDEHHTMEDVAIVLGEAIDKALGSKLGIGRYGFVLPMDDCDAMVLMDFGGRIDFRWDVEFTRDRVGDVPTEMFEHFFQSLASAMKVNMHIKAVGTNDHHKAESIFKAFARALRMAVSRSQFPYELPSSKGLL